MQLTLNIELYVGRTNQALDVYDAVQHVQRTFPWIKRFRHAVRLNTEGRETLVTRFDMPVGPHADVPAFLNMLCETTDQEAIAYKLGEVGALAGPAAESWGAFNQSLFLEF